MYSCILSSWENGSQRSDRFLSENLLKIIEHVSYSIKYCKISLRIFSGSRSLSNAGVFFISPSIFSFCKQNDFISRSYKVMDNSKTKQGIKNVSKGLRHSIVLFTGINENFHCRSPLRSLHPWDAMAFTIIYSAIFIGS